MGKKNNILGENLRIMRMTRGFTQEEVAAAIGSSQSEVSAFEKGRHKPALKRLMAYSDLFGISIDELVGRAENDTILFYDDERQRVRKKKY